MNIKEFNEIKEQFGQTMYAYEQFIKKGYLLEMMYNYHFHDEIVIEYKINIENELYKNVLDMLHSKQSLDLVDAYIDNARKIHAQNLVSLDKKFNNAKAIVHKMDSMSEEEDVKLEEEFKKFVMISHPAVRGSVSKEDSSMYKQARQFYLINNLPGFIEIQQLFMKSFVPSEIKEEDYVKYSQYYYKTMEDMKLDAANKVNQFPYSIENVFDDDITLASEKAEFKVKLNKISGLNDALKKDIIETYGEEINL